MAHYAFLNESNIVTEVIVGKDESEDGGNWEQRYGSFRGQVCKRTSYNTHGGIHKNRGIAFRKNYAGIGFSYDEQRDAFIPPQPYPSWILNEDSCLWEAPVPMPSEGVWQWNEDQEVWVEI